jgi:hypothetical protein
MTSHAGFETAAAALEFMMAGKAIFTMTSAASGDHFTYKISSNEDETMYFANVKYKHDGDWTDYRYIGFIKGGKLIAGKKGTPTADSFKALAWALAHLNSGAIPAQLTIQHEGACCVCARPLTDPVSIATGIGPICAGRG